MKWVTFIGSGLSFFRITNETVRRTNCPNSFFIWFLTWSLQLLLPWFLHFLTDLSSETGLFIYGFPPNALWVDTAEEELRRQCNLAPGSFLARTPIVYSLYLVPRDLDTSWPSYSQLFWELSESRDPLCECVRGYFGNCQSHEIYCVEVPGV